MSFHDAETPEDLPREHRGDYEPPTLRRYCFWCEGLTSQTETDDGRTVCTRCDHLNGVQEH